MICLTRVSISYSFIMARLRHNSVQLHVISFDIENDICFNVHVESYQYIQFRHHDHLVSPSLTNIYEVTDLINHVSVHIQICCYMWICFTLVSIFIFVSIHIFIPYNSCTDYLTNER